MYQQVTMVGNMGSDPILRYTPSGVPVCDFRFATNKSFNDAQGNKVEKTIWWKITAWRKLAEIIAQYGASGRQVLVIGEIDEPKIWNDKNSGEARVTLEVTAETIRLIGSRPAEASNGNGNTNGHYAPTPTVEETKARLQAEPTPVF